MLPRRKERFDKPNVSGHPCRDELRAMYEWARPKISIPVHGEARHLEEHADFAETLGVRETLAPRNGDLIRLAPDGPEILDEVPAGRMYLDGDILLPHGAAPMRERRKLSHGGLLAVSVVFDRRNDLADNIEIDAEGICFGGPDTDGFEKLLVEQIEDAVLDLRLAKRKDNEAVELAVKRAARNFFDARWGKRPLIKTLIHRLAR